MYSSSKILQKTCDGVRKITSFINYSLVYKWRARGYGKDIPENGLEGLHNVRLFSIEYLELTLILSRAYCKNYEIFCVRKLCSTQQIIRIVLYYIHFLNLKY